MILLLLRVLFELSSETLLDEANRIVQKAAQMYDTQAEFIATKPAPKCHEDTDKIKAVELKHWLKWKKRKGDPAICHQN